MLVKPAVAAAKKEGAAAGRKEAVRALAQLQTDAPQTARQRRAHAVSMRRAACALTPPCPPLCSRVRTAVTAVTARGRAAAARLK